MMIVVEETRASGRYIHCYEAERKKRYILLSARPARDNTISKRELYVVGSKHSKVPHALLIELLRSRLCVRVRA